MTIHQALTEPSRLATRGQRRDLAMAMAAAGITSRERALGYVHAVVGRPVESRRQLTTREASTVLDALEHPTRPEQDR